MESGSNACVTPSLTTETTVIVKNLGSSGHRPTARCCPFFQSSGQQRPETSENQEGRRRSPAEGQGQPSPGDTLDLGSGPNLAQPPALEGDRHPEAALVTCRSQVSREMGEAGTCSSRHPPSASWSYRALLMPASVTPPRGPAGARIHTYAHVMHMSCKYIYVTLG